MSTSITHTVLDRNDIVAAKNAIAAYKNTCKTEFTNLKNEIDTLRQTHFIGDASTGYDAFFTTIAPALSANLYGDGNSVTALLEQLLDAIEQALMNKADVDLGNANKNAANNQNVAAPVANQN